MTMRLTDLPLDQLRFRTSDEVADEIRHACGANPDLATFHDLGKSEQGRPLYGVTLGFGPETVTLVSGAHADEPVGPETLRTLILESLANRDWLAEDDGVHELLERVTFRIIPHVNPDGEAANQRWISAWPDVNAYLLHRRREPPGRDVEFGYPVMRPENRIASCFLFDYSPLALHMSLHGMGFAEGALLLIERHWADATGELREHWRRAVVATNLRLHDHDRGGEKGFRYLGPGFWSTPEGTAMREHFLALRDQETARKFFLSSMEMARVAGYDARRERHPLCLVTELPLFVIEAEHERVPGVPAALLELQEAIPAIEARLREGDDAVELIEPFQLRPLPPEDAVRLQLRAIELGLEAVGVLVATRRRIERE
jgi:hypothetical protein